MTPGRIAELLAPFFVPAGLKNQESGCHSEGARSAREEPAFLSDHQLLAISTYIDLLLRWNSRINLTAIRDPEAIVTRHFGESFFVAQRLFAATEARQCQVAEPASSARPSLADIGSGAGFPGLPIKLWTPGISLTLVESNFKKATFLREVSRTLTLTDVDVRIARAEQLSDGSFDVVTLRAVERFEDILPVTTRLVSPAGRLALLIGSAQFAQTQSLLPQIIWQAPTAIPLSDCRILAIGTPVSNIARNHG